MSAIYGTSIAARCEPTLLWLALAKGRSAIGNLDDNPTDFLIMKFQHRLASQIKLLLLLASALFNVSATTADEAEQKPILLHAARVFDGDTMQTDASVLLVNGKVAQVDKRGAIKSDGMTVIDLGDATLLPGFIELHAHIAYHNIPEDTILAHGITTIRDVGGPLHKPYGGDGSLRVLSAGLLITAPGGYPIPIMGNANIATPVATEEEARQTVRNLIDGGAVAIKIALEPGGEPGAPWSSGHSHHHGHAEHGGSHRELAHKQPAWPLLPTNIVSAIVDEAHKQGRMVTAHIGEAKGAQIALDAGVDEWAHIPCASLPETLLKKAATQNVKLVTTLDTLSHCHGSANNATKLAALGAELLYGAEIAHPDIPWGIDAHELILMMRLANMSPIEVLRAATSKAGKHLDIPLLGTLQAGAPADLIAVKGNPLDSLDSMKTLEYPSLVVSGGKIIVDKFTQPRRGALTAGD